jgi:DNA repair protein RecO (recombination protein O)
MLHKTRGIVLSYIKYKDTSVIVKVYTEAFGLQSYIQNGARSSNSKTNKMSLLQPLLILDMVVYHKSGQELHRISEMKPAYIYQTLHTDLRKVSVVTFITEILLKCLKEEIKNEDLLNFIQESLITFDHIDNDVFHLQFMLKLSQYIGFHPHNADEFFMQLQTEGFYRIGSVEGVMTAFESILNSNYENKVIMTPKVRSALIDLIVSYYGIHIEKFGELKSLKILREL